MEIFNYDNRELRILNILEKSSAIKEEYLQNVLKVSSKTIKNEIKKLNIFFKNTAYIKVEKEIYKLYIIKFEKYLEMKKQLSKSYENFDSNKVRIVFILKELIESKNYKLIDDLSEVMTISRTTFNNDIKKLKDIIRPYELKIQGKTNTGIALKGQEKDIRLFILENIYNYICKDDIFDLEDNQNFIKIFKKNNINIQIYDIFLKYLTISLTRYGNEFYLNFKKGLYDELLEYYTLPFINEILDYIYIKYNLKLNEDEKKFLTICFATMRTPLHIKNIGLNITNIEEYEDIILQILEKINNNYGLNLDISEVKKEFIYHIYFLMKRLKYGVRYKNNMKEKIKDRYPMSYKFSLEARDIIKEKYKYDISEDEICYLAIYFETFFNKITTEKRNINILLVTLAGPAYIKLMENDLKNYISNLNLTITDSYQKNNFSKYDLIISTISDKYETNIPVIYQNEILDYEYIKKEIYLYNYMGKINIPVMKGMESILLSSISKTTFYICDAKKSYKNNVRDMIDRLMNNGLVDEGFLCRMKEREKKSSMIFTDKIAFPHTDNRLNSKFLISIGISEYGFKDNKDLKIILLAAIPSNKDNSLILTKTYEELISLARNTEALEHIEKIKDYKELVNYFIKNINMYK